MAQLPINVDESIRTTLGALTYGQPIELDGHTVIPVSLASYGFGAGEDAQSSNDRTGGGGGGASIPVGVYVQSSQGVVFKPNAIALIAVATPAIVSVGFALSRIIRALKK